MAVALRSYKTYRTTIARVIYAYAAIPAFKDSGMLKHIDLYIISAHGSTVAGHWASYVDKQQQNYSHLAVPWRRNDVRLNKCSFCAKYLESHANKYWFFAPRRGSKCKFVLWLVLLLVHRSFSDHLDLAKINFMLGKLFVLWLSAWPVSAVVELNNRCSWWSFCNPMGSGRFLSTAVINVASDSTWIVSKACWSTGEVHAASRGADYASGCNHAIGRAWSWYTYGASFIRFHGWKCKTALLQCRLYLEPKTIGLQHSKGPILLLSIRSISSRPRVGKRPFTPCISSWL